MSETTIQLKQCRECETTRSTEEFKPDRRYKDDLHPICKQCLKVGLSANGGEPAVERERAQEAPANRISTAMDRPPDVNPNFHHRVDPLRRTKDKCAIVGFTMHREAALELGDDFEFWGLNELYNFMPVERFHRWFEIHERTDFEDDPGKKHLADLAEKMDIPVYMHESYADIPASVRFPKTEIERQLDSEYFTSSPAWMIGMAIAMGFKEIHVYGVDMAQETEYFGQRSCCEHWLGYAAGRGIKTYLPDESDLCKAIGQYGFGTEGSLFHVKLTERTKWLHEQDNQALAAMRSLTAEFDEKSKNLKAEFDQKYGAVSAERNQLVGAITDCGYWLRSWAVQAAAPSTGSAVPDRSEDPMTGITE